MIHPEGLITFQRLTLTFRGINILASLKEPVQSGILIDFRTDVGMGAIEKRIAFPFSNPSSALEMVHPSNGDDPDTERKQFRVVVPFRSPFRLHKT